jgi:putative membrane protein
LWLTVSFLLTALLYTRGWFAIRKTRVRQFDAWRLSAFLLGVAVLWIAVCSPLEELADVLLSAHMVEHLLIMSIAPPLLLFAAPVVPLLRGVPRGVRNLTVSPLLRAAALRRLGHWLGIPIVAWLAMNISFLVWHVPGAYDFALEHEAWHDFEHLCFLGSSLLFWWCVVRPWPAAKPQAGWGLLGYLVSADIVNTVLSAFLAFCGRPVYAYYVEHPNRFGFAPLADQVLGAVIMWVFGSIVFLVPAVVVTVRLLQQKPA